MLRPYIHKVFKKLSGPEFQEGEQEQVEYRQRRAKAAIQPNDIREGSKAKDKDATTLGQIEGDGAVTSGSNVNAVAATENEVKSRKAQRSSQRQAVSGASAADEPEIEKVLDWEDERPENLNPDQSSQGQDDIKAWVDKWTQ